jgi:hypothetical protein
MYPLNPLQWLGSVVFGNRHRRNGPCRHRRRSNSRKAPPLVRIDLSGERNPLTRPPSPRLDSPRACLLLDVLPLEIRQLIWAEVLGDHYLHLRVEKGILIGGLCVSPTPNTCHSGHNHCRFRHPDPRIELEKYFLLQILLSCKQM